VEWHSHTTSTNLLPIPVTMNPPDIHTPFLPPNLLPSRSSVISVSTGIHKLTDETHGFIAQMLVLQIHPQEIAQLTGISVHSVYRVWEQCLQNSGAYQVSREPTKAGWPQLMTKEDINVCIPSKLIISADILY